MSMFFFEKEYGVLDLRRDLPYWNKAGRAIITDICAFFKKIRR